MAQFVFRVPIVQIDITILHDKTSICLTENNTYLYTVSYMSRFYAKLIYCLILFNAQKKTRIILKI